MINDKCKMINDKCRGFTLLELLVVLTFITAFGFLVATRFGTITEGAGVACALTEMGSIKETIKEGFYPDLGLIPEDTGADGLPGTEDDRPEYSTRYLCLRNDGKDNPQYTDMKAFLESKGIKENMLEWDKYSRRGWRGPYMEQDVSASFDPDGPDGPRKERYIPLIATPWADSCEKNAQKEEDLGNNDLAEKYRKGKYYLIVGGQEKKEARIVCFGANCLDDGSYCKDHDQERPINRATAQDLNNPEYDTGDDVVVFIFGGGFMRSPH